jgi:citrate lyase beta subunit
VTTGADICIFDLEDSVPPARIDEARRTVADAVIKLAAGTRLWVRVHAASTPHMLADLAAFPLERVEGIVLPKVDRPEDVDACQAYASRQLRSKSLAVLAIVESAAGVLNGPQIARADGVVCLALGRFDLSADLGVDPEHRTPALSAARAIVVLASAAARLHAPLDSPWLRIPDLDGLRAAAEQGRRDGFGGMLLIHPSHVPTVNQVFSPTADEVAWARGIVAAADQAAAGGRGAFASDGEMVDEAIVRRARTILRDADR